MTWPRALLASIASALAVGGPAFAVTPAATPLPAAPGGELEPNDSAATASAIASGQRVRATVGPALDVDYYRFSAQAGDRVFAATMTNASAGGNSGAPGAQNTQLTLLGGNGTTVLEFDDDNGAFGASSSSISGAAIPAAGTYYLKVNEPAAAQLLYYDLFLQLRSAAPAPETGSNDTPATADPLPGGYASGARDPAAAGEQDWYALALDAGDTVFLSLDLDPERDGTTWNGRLGLGVFGDADNQVLTVDDAGAAEAPSPTIPSEAFFMTVKAAGTYYVRVDAADAATGGPAATYRLSASVIAAARPSCRTHTATPAPGTIADGATTTFPIDVGDAAVIDRVAIALDVTHTLMADLDVSLKSPNGNEIALFTDIGATATGGQTHMELLLDQNAATGPAFAPVRQLVLQPELAARLTWLDGQAAAGMWSLVIRDDTANAQTGSLARADLVLCARPADGPATTVFAAGFESGDDGFTHSGTADEWERGTPATAATPAPNPVAGLSACATGTMCFKTDLDNTYDDVSAQDLLSPPISLAARTGKITASWAQWYQMETARFDHASVSIEEDGGANARPLWTWADGTMTAALGSPVVIVPTAAGWGEHRADISDYAGKTIRLRFHLDSDATIHHAGLAIDDVRVLVPTPPPVAAPPPPPPPPVAPPPPPPPVVVRDTTAPNTRLLAKPPRFTRSRSARFTFVSTEKGSTFTCKLDARRATRCRSPVSYRRLKRGATHRFSVYATDTAGNRDDTPAKYTFRIRR